MCWFGDLWCFHTEDWNFNQWLPTIGLFFRTLAFSSIWKMCSSPHMFISANISVSLQCIPPYIFALVPKLEFDAFKFLCTDKYSRQQKSMRLCTAVNLCHMFHEILDLCRSFFTGQVNWTIVSLYSNYKELGYKMLDQFLCHCSLLFFLQE